MAAVAANLAHSTAERDLASFTADKITMNTESNIEMVANVPRYFKIRMPSPSGWEQDDAEAVKSLTITAMPELASAYYQESDLILASTALPDTAPSEDEHTSVLSDPVWSHGQAIRLREDSHSALDSSVAQWCYDCWITVMLKVQKSGSYALTAKAGLGQAQTIFEDRVLYGLTSYGEKECYRYNVKDEDSNVDINFKMYSGIATQVVNPLEIPEDYREAKFEVSTPDLFDTSMRITPEMRRDQKIGLYYICVFAHMTSSFSITVKESDKNLGYQVMMPDFVYHSTLEDKNDKKVFLYSVPRVDFDIDRLTIDFDIFRSESGSVPLMAIALCNEYQSMIDAAKQCGERYSGKGRQDLEASKDVQWAAQTPGLPMARATVQHDVSQCRDESGQFQSHQTCFYVLTVLPDEKAERQTGEIKFSVQGQARPQGSILLREHKPVIGEAKRNQDQFYRFHLSDASKIDSVAILLQTLHGDADLYVSREREFPEMYDQADKSSNKAKGLLDQVVFEAGKDGVEDLTGDYFIGVHGQQESVFELTVIPQSSQVKRTDARAYRLMEEGLERQASLHDEAARGQFRFEVDMPAGFERGIHISLNMKSPNAVTLYLRYGQPPEEKEFGVESDLMIKDQSIIDISIPTDDELFHASGTYFLLVVPDPTLLELFARGDLYDFGIKYNMEGSFDFINMNQLVEATQDRDSLRLFKFVIADPHENHRLMINSHDGPLLHYTISYDAEDARLVDFARHTGSTSHGHSSVWVVDEDSTMQSTSCWDDSLSPCVLYIGIRCEDDRDVAGDCRYSMRISADSESHLQQIAVGAPFYDSVADETYNYYYLELTEKMLNFWEEQQGAMNPIRLVLHPQMGSAGLYVSLQQNSDIQPDRQSWARPTTFTYDYKSDSHLAQEVVTIDPADIKQCFEDSKRASIYKKYKSGTPAECALVVAVYGDGQESFTPYSLTSYISVQRLFQDKPVEARVGEGAYQYFIFDMACDDCALMIGLQSFSGGDPDLFITFNQTKEGLPDKDEYDIKSNVHGSEALELTLDSDYFKTNRIHSMRGTYLIAVFGRTATSFVISAAYNKHRIKPLVNNLPLKASQGSYETEIFRYEPVQDGDFIDDIRIHLKVTAGIAEMFVSVYDPVDDSKTLTQRLPTSMRQSDFHMGKVMSTSDESRSEIIISVADEAYCANCQYLIGVHSADSDLSYELTASLMGATVEVGNMLRIGTPTMVELPADAAPMYRFIIDQEGDFSITLDKKVGEDIVTELYMGDELLESFENSGSLSVSQSDPDFFVAKMYSLLIKNDHNSFAEAVLVVEQANQVIELHNGQTMKVRFTGGDEVSKNFIMPLPAGDSTLTLMVEPKGEIGAQRLKPFIYYKRIKNLGLEKDTIDFPPATQDADFRIKRQYSKRGSLQVTQRLTDVGEDEGVAFTVWVPPMNRETLNEANPLKVVVFAGASAAGEQILSKDQQYMKTLFEEESVHYLKLGSAFKEAHARQYTVLEYSYCFGKINTAFVEDPLTDPKEIEPFSTFELYGKHQAAFKTSEIRDRNFYIVVEAVSASNGVDHRDGAGARSQYLIEGRQISNLDELKGKVFPASAQLSTLLSPKSSRVMKLMWQPLLLHTHQTNTALDQPTEFAPDEVRYFVIYAEEGRGQHLESVCTLEDDVWKEHGYVRREQRSDQGMTVTEDDLGLVPGKTYHANVFAAVVKGQHEGEVFAYKEIKINMPKQGSSYSMDKSRPKLWTVLLTLGCVACMLAVCFFGRNDSHDSVLSTVVSQVKNMVAPPRPQNNDRERQYQGMNEFSNIDTSVSSEQA